MPEDDPQALDMILTEVDMDLVILFFSCGLIVGFNLSIKFILSPPEVCLCRLQCKHGSSMDCVNIYSTDTNLIF